MKTVIIALSVVAACFAQRSPYAGRRGIGYPSIEFTPSPIATTTTAGTILNNDLGQRSGASDVTTPSTTTTTTTTVRIPVEANGDANLVNRLMQLPVDHQPFWLINWRALDDLRSQPRSYAAPKNYFVDFASSQNRGNNV